MLDQNDHNELNLWEGYFSYQPTIVYKWASECTCDVLFLSTGNQFGKNKTTAQLIWDYICGLLPVEHHNIRPEDSVRIIRCAS